MSKPKGWFRIHREHWAGEAWRGLPANAQVVLVDILYRYTTKNNGRIAYGVRDATRRLHCGLDTARNALNELQAAGLIEPTVRASFNDKSGASKGRATQWRLTFVK
jgi:hypothetical protein